jgi:hypothetical protein
MEHLIFLCFSPEKEVLTLWRGTFSLGCHFAPLLEIFVALLEFQ